MAAVKGTQDLVLLEAQSTAIRCYFDIGIGDTNGEYDHTAKMQPR